MRFNSYRGLSALALAGVAAASRSSSSSSSSDSYDYIVVGGGPAGIITAERISETNKKVLLVERGPGNTVGTGANYTLDWNSTLTPPDVPGLSTAIGSTPLWTEYMCTDTAGNAACVLGGGVTVNYMVFIHPPAHDFDDKWPKGWKWNDVSAAADRLYERNPGTNLPSQDGVRYETGLYDTLATFFSGLGWKSVDMSEQPNEKHQVYSHPTWNIKNTMRAGPVRTYLPLAQERDNFTLRLGTKVIRLVRKGSRVTGVEVENSAGVKEIISLSKNGRVVLAAGALSTPRILFNSGIGPKKYIQVAQKSGVTVPAEKEWIELPVGQNLKDHPIFNFMVDTGASWGPLDTASVLNSSDVTDIDLYEQKGSGILTQGKHSLIFFTTKNGTDGINRYYQGSLGAESKGVFSIKAYLTHGLTSSGVLGLAENGSTILEQSPYLQTDGDIDSATEFIQDLLDDLATETSWSLTGNNNASAILASPSTGNHYVGTAKMGTDDGRKGGSSVVDTNTKVYGTDNLFISDASIHPDVSNGNSQAIIMVVAEAAAKKILGC